MEEFKNICLVHTDAVKNEELLEGTIELNPQVLVLCLVEYKRCHLWWVTGSWKNSRGRCLLPAIWLGKACQKCPIFINRKDAIFQHDNVRTHSEKQIQEKI